MTNLSLGFGIPNRVGKFKNMETLAQVRSAERTRRTIRARQMGKS